MWEDNSLSKAMNFNTAMPQIPAFSTKGAKTRLTQTFTDGSAEQQFWHLYNRYREEDSTGIVWGLTQWPTAKFIEAPILENTAHLMAHEVLTIDSGNSAGDKWKYTYFPQTGVGLFIDEIAP